MLHVSVIGGYALEEVLARLMADNGYRLLTSEVQDPARLRRDKHGLLVRGRGTDHQADALGDLNIPIPFSLPVRLFAEAKNRVAKTGLDATRNALGVISDVNQFQPDPAIVQHWRGDASYHYRYSLFSTSGFTAPAEDFALAHQISLIDLSGPSFAKLRRSVEIFASAVQSLAIRDGLSAFPTGQMRAAMRVALGTASGTALSADPSTGEMPQMAWPELVHLAAILAASIEDDLVLGFPEGSQVLALRPDDPVSFRSWASSVEGVVAMRLRFAPGEPHGEWIVLPASPSMDRRLVLRFSTPPALAEWLFSAEGETRRRIANAERGLFSAITIYQAGRPIVLTLDLAPRSDATPRTGEADLSELREVRMSPEFAWDSVEASRANDEPSPWSVEAVAALVALLEQRDPRRLAVMLYAAAHGDWISRAHIFDIMGFPAERKMSGFTKPFKGLVKELAKRNLVDADTPTPMVARYPNTAGWAAGLDLNVHVGRTLRNDLSWLLGHDEPG